MPSTCVFELDRPEPVYYSGETISGRTTLTTTSDKSVKEVYIQLVGQAKVRWEENPTEDRTEVYEASELYVNTRTNVFPEGTLAAGTHVFEFQFPLPLQCPTHIVETTGNISYELSLVASRPDRCDNCFTKNLSIIKQLDLNIYPELLIPLRSECCCPCPSGSVLTTLTIPFGGYARGQQINYSLTMENRSLVPSLEVISLRLRRTYCFNAHSPCHKTCKSVITLEEHCHRGSKRVVEGVLNVPLVTPSSDDGGIIQVSYDIEMTVKFGDFHADMYTPIKIGTIPLTQSATHAENTVTLLPTGTSAGRRLDILESLLSSSEAVTTFGGVYDNGRDSYDSDDDCCIGMLRMCFCSEADADADADADAGSDCSC